MQKHSALFYSNLSLPPNGKKFSSTQCVDPLDSIHSTTKLHEIGSSKEENGADKEEGSGRMEDITLVTKGRGNKCKYTHYTFNKLSLVQFASQMYYQIYCCTLPPLQDACGHFNSIK